MPLLYCMSKPYYFYIRSWRPEHLIVEMVRAVRITN